MTATETTSYIVGLTADGADASGHTIFGDIGLERLEEAGLSWRLLPEIPVHGPVDPVSLEGVDAVISFGHIPFDADLVRRTPRLRHVARFGAGYDGIDPVGLAGEGVVVSTAPEAVRKPMALTAVTLVLACAHRLVENHEVTSSGAWATGRGRHRGVGIAGRTVGIVGLGSVGSLAAEQLQSLGLDVIALDRPSARATAASLGVELVDLPELARRSDFVVVTAALTPQNRRMIGPEFFAEMQSTAYFVNIARGGLVDQGALTQALETGQIAGAALDVYDPEPPSPEEPLLKLPNVIVTPHALCWTADFTRDVSASVVESLIAASRGEIPPAALVRDSLDSQTWRGAGQN